MTKVPVIRNQDVRIQFYPNTLIRTFQIDLLRKWCNSDWCEHLSRKFLTQVGRLRNLKILRFEISYIEDRGISAIELDVSVSSNNDWEQVQDEIITALRTFADKVNQAFYRTQ